MGNDISVTTVEREKPTLVTIGNREVISNGRWNDGLMAEYVFRHGHDKWLKIIDLSRHAFLNGSPRNQDRTRQCIHKLFNAVLARGHILVVEYQRANGTGRAKAVKLFDPSSQLDRQTLGIKIERMRQRGAISADKLHTVISIISADGLPIEDVPSPPTAA